MGIDGLAKVIQNGAPEAWAATNKTCFDRLFGAPDGRYPQKAHNLFQLRAPEMRDEKGVPYAAYIHPSNPTSGPYSGTSFVVFPVPDAPCLIGLVVGSQGLSPDEAILGRPGHARKAQAICAWLNKKYGQGHQVAWAKEDPTRTDISVPDKVKQDWSAYQSPLDRYQKEVYALYRPTHNPEGTIAATKAFLDLLLLERGHQPLGAYQVDAEQIQSEWFDSLMPGVETSQVQELLRRRRYVIVQGPPGTGKTRLATELLADTYHGFGKSVQFHPNTTYESVIGGLAPAQAATGQNATDFGLRFQPAPGCLMEAATEAIKHPDRPYLLHIDEINRADLGKVLGEAIFLLEPDADRERKIDLPYNFGAPFHRTLSLPPNLHILGTMNSSDRSIAIVDVAVRRRFAFVSLWPRSGVVNQLGSPSMQAAFKELLSIFIDHASPEALALVPGHSYFLEPDEQKGKENLQVTLAPLLEEYLAQGYVSGFAEPIRSYLQWLRAL